MLVLHNPYYGDHRHQVRSGFGEDQVQSLGWNRVKRKTQSSAVESKHLLSNCSHFSFEILKFYFPLSGVHVVLFSAILSLGVGDTMASIVGSRFGSNKWPGTEKTIEGTCAAVGFQLVTMVILTSSVTVHYTSWIGILISVVLTSIVEAFTTQIDNIILPVFMHILLLSLQ